MLEKTRERPQREVLARPSDARAWASRARKGRRAVANITELYWLSAFMTRPESSSGFTRRACDVGAPT